MLQHSQDFAQRQVIELFENGARVLQSVFHIPRGVFRLALRVVFFQKIQKRDGGQQRSQDSGRLEVFLGSAPDEELHPEKS